MVSLGNELVGALDALDGAAEGNGLFCNEVVAGHIGHNILIGLEYRGNLDVFTGHYEILGHSFPLNKVVAFGDKILRALDGFDGVALCIGLNLDLLAVNDIGNGEFLFLDYLNGAGNGLVFDIVLLGGFGAEEHNHIWGKVVLSDFGLVLGAHGDGNYRTLNINRLIHDENDADGSGEGLIIGDHKTESIRNGVQNFAVFYADGFEIVCIILDIDLQTVGSVDAADLKGDFKLIAGLDLIGIGVHGEHNGRGRLLNGLEYRGVGDVAGYFGNLGIPTDKGVGVLIVLGLGGLLAVIGGHSAVLHILVHLKLGLVPIQPCYGVGFDGLLEYRDVGDVAGYFGNLGIPADEGVGVLIVLGLGGFLAVIGGHSARFNVLIDFELLAVPVYPSYGVGRHDLGLGGGHSHVGDVIYIGGSGFAVNKARQLDVEIVHTGLGVIRNVHIEGVDNAFIGDQRIGNHPDNGNLAGGSLILAEVEAARIAHRIEHCAGSEFVDLKSTRVIIHSELNAAHLVLAGDIDRYLNVVAGINLLGGFNEDLRIEGRIVRGSIVYQNTLGMTRDGSGRAAVGEVREIGVYLDEQYEAVLVERQILLCPEGCGIDFSAAGERIKWHHYTVAEDLSVRLQRNHREAVACLSLSGYLTISAGNILDHIRIELKQQLKDMRLILAFDLDYNGELLTCSYGLRHVRREIGIHFRRIDAAGACRSRFRQYGHRNKCQHHRKSNDKCDKSLH